MFLYLWGALLIIVILIKLWRFLYFRAQDQNKIVSVALLEEKVKTADVYEIAYLKGRETEMWRMALYTLLNSGYIKENEEKSSKRGPSEKEIKFYFDDTKDPQLLHPVERKVLETCKGIDNSENLDERKGVIYSSLSIFVKYYKDRHEGLYLICPVRLFEFLGCFFIVILFAMPIFLYSMNYRNQKLIPIMVIMNIIALMIVTRIHIPSSPALTPNGKRFLKLFGKIHFPYPESKKVSDAQYTDMMVLWC
jgi:uncharacterized protein (TIGR04222 family)